MRDLVNDPAGVVYRIAWIADTGDVLLVTGQAVSTEMVRVDPTGKRATIWSDSTGARVRDLHVREDGAAVRFAMAMWSRSFWLLEPR